MVYADTSFKGHLVAKESAMRIIFTISDYCIGALRKARSCGGSIGDTLLVHCRQVGRELEFGSLEAIAQLHLFPGGPSFEASPGAAPCFKGTD